MGRRLTNEEREATNTRSGQAKSKQKTVAKEILTKMVVETELITDLTDDFYPPSLCISSDDAAIQRSVDAAKSYYRTLVLDSEYLTTVLSRPMDRIIFAQIAYLLVQVDELLLAGINNCVIVEGNGNDKSLMQTKTHPAIKEVNGKMRVIKSLLNEMGLTPVSRSTIMIKLTYIKSEMVHINNGKGKGKGSSFEEYLGACKLK